MTVSPTRARPADPRGLAPLCCVATGYQGPRAPDGEHYHAYLCYDEKDIMWARHLKFYLKRQYIARDRVHIVVRPLRPNARRLPPHCPAASFPSPRRRPSLPHQISTKDGCSPQHFNTTTV